MSGIGAEMMFCTTSKTPVPLTLMIPREAGPGADAKAAIVELPSESSEFMLLTWVHSMSGGRRKLNAVLPLPRVGFRCQIDTIAGKR